MPRRCLLLMVATLLMGSSCDDAEPTPDLGDQAGTELDAEQTELADDVPDDVEVCRTSAREPAEQGVRTGLVGLGTFPNAIVMQGNHGYVVNSGDNAVQRYELSSPSNTQTSFVNVGPDMSPYDLAVSDGQLYITNNLGNSLTIAGLDGSILQTLAASELRAPQDLLLTEDYLIVAATEFSYPAPETQFGSVLVFSRGAEPKLLRRIQTRYSNPQFLLRYRDELLVVSSGATDFDLQSYLMTPKTEGGVERFALDTLLSAEGSHFALGMDGLVGNPGRPALVGDVLYLGSGTAPVLFAIDLAKGEVVHDASNPLQVFAAAGANALVAPFAGPLGLLYVLDFNNDALYVYEPGCGQWVLGPVDLGESAELMEGPLDLAWTPEGTAHVLMSVSSTLSSFEPSKLLR